MVPLRNGIVITFLKSYNHFGLEQGYCEHWEEGSNVVKRFASNLNRQMSFSH